MSSGELLGFHYRFEGGDPGARTVLLLHGTGADENDLIPLGRAIAPDANLLSPRGKVLEAGFPRFFERFSDGTLDIEDLKRRTHELVGFIEAATKEHELDASRIVAVGFSNGANIAESTLLLHPETLEATALLRPMFTFEPDGPPDLHGVRVFIASGRSDPLIDPRDPERLAQLLGGYGAEVELSFSTGGHSLGPDEVDRARQWFQKL
jgi:predicted esterase